MLQLKHFPVQPGSVCVCVCVCESCVRLGHAHCQQRFRFDTRTKRENESLYADVVSVCMSVCVYM